MTSYTFTLVISESESIMLSEALKLMVQHCKDELSANPRAPYFVWKACAESVQARLYDNAVLRSSNNFSDMG
jgi:hypothetical protein